MRCDNAHSLPSVPFAAPVPNPALSKANEAVWTWCDKHRLAATDEGCSSFSVSF